mgnify:CR=1 FL=1
MKKDKRCTQMKKTCETCKFFKIGQGKFGTGLCVSDNSKKHNKDCVLKRDTCKSWERRTNE